MSTPAEWARGYARQADADLRAWELYETHPAALAAGCHKLMFLQMACEKLCKAYLIRTGTPPEALQASHGYVAKPLPVVIRDYMSRLSRRPVKMGGVLTHVRHLAGEIEALNPAVRRDGRRPDNCEYPWEDAAGVLQTPLDWNFSPSRLCTAPAGRTFLKLLRGAINGVM